MNYYDIWIDGTTIGNIPAKDYFEAYDFLLRLPLREGSKVKIIRL